MTWRVMGFSHIRLAEKKVHERNIGHNHSENDMISNFETNTVFFNRSFPNRLLDFDYMDFWLSFGKPVNL